MDTQDTAFAGDVVVTPSWNPGPPFMAWRRQPQGRAARRKIQPTAAVRRLVGRWRERQAYRALGRLDDRLLADMGLTRSDLRRASRHLP